MKRFVIILFTITFAIGAEIAPKYYKEMQEKAPDVVKIQVLDVSKGWCFFCSDKSIKVEAKILEVTRSASNLKVGNKIEIRYEYKPLKEQSGPRPVPILIENKTYPAYLIKAGDHFEPAARGYSFEPL